MGRKGLKMEHILLYTHSVRGTLREGPYTADFEKKHVMGGSGWGLFLL
jgi:hypothetical protein